MEKYQEYAIAVSALVGLVIAIFSIIYTSNTLALISAAIAVASILISIYFIYQEEEAVEIIRRELKKEQNRLDREETEIRTKENKTHKQ